MKAILHLSDLHISLRNHSPHWLSKNKSNFIVPTKAVDKNSINNLYIFPSRMQTPCHVLSANGKRIGRPKQRRNNVNCRFFYLLSVDTFSICNIYLRLAAIGCQANANICKMDGKPHLIISKQNNQHSVRLGNLSLLFFLTIYIFPIELIDKG